MTLSKARWEAECKLMAGLFPDFKPYVEESLVGFRGHLQGPRSGRPYSVVLRAATTEYPLLVPTVFIHPRPEPQYHEADGQLSFLLKWNPARGSFARTLLVAFRYLQEFDRSEEGGESK